MKRVLVTGANGFIGRHCLPMLLERGFEVHAVTHSRYAAVDLPDVHWNVTDLLDSRQVSSLFEDVRPTHLLHLAWYTVPNTYWTSLENLRWLQAGIDVMRAFKAHGGERVVFAGTCAEYDWQFGYCSEQLTPLAPATLYGVCKNALYQVLRSFSEQEDMSMAWGRIFFLYGPYEHTARLVPSVINSLLDGQPVQCTHGNQIRDFSHVADVASAFVAMLDGSVQGAVNIASGRAIRLKEVIGQIAEYFQRPDLIHLDSIPAPDNEAPLLLADISRLSREVHWFPAYNLASGLEMTIDWWKRRKKHGPENKLPGM